MTVTLPYKKNLTIYKGASFQHRFLWVTPDEVPVNLTGYSARMQIREDYDSPVTLELTTENNRLVVGNKNGNVDLLVTASETTALTIDNGIYDLELVNGEEVIKLALGKVKIVPEVTR